MKYGIELHARGRLLVTCEAYDKAQGMVTVVSMQGYVSHREPGSVIVIIPKSNNPIHRFSTIDTGDGYGVEGSPSSKRGWRIKLSQLKLKDVPEITKRDDQ